MHNALRLIALTAAVSALTACPTTEGAKKDDGPVATTTPSAKEVRAARLCEIHTEVQSARFASRLVPLNASFREDASGTSQEALEARFGAIMSRSNAKKSWEGFRDETRRSSTTILFPLGECLVYAEWKMDDQAPSRCAAAKESDPQMALADVGLATLWLNKKAYDKALAAADAALATDAACASAYIVKAQTLEAKSDRTGAVAAYDAALKAKSDCFMCAAERARLLSEADDIDAATAAWEEAFKIIPDHGPSLQRYASLQVGRDDAKALSAYEQAIAKGEGSYVTLLAAAQLAARTGEVLKAIDYGERAARIEPDHVEQWRLLASLYQKRNEAEAIEKAYEEVLRLLPDDHQAHLALARLAAKEERFVEAIGHYGAANAAPVPEGDAAAAELHATGVTEEKALHEKLQIAAKVVGAPEVVQDRVRRTVQTLFKARHKPGTKGKIVVTVKTFKDGGVEEANVLEDTLKDPYVAASLLGNLERANISGGRKLYEFEYTFQ